MEHSHIVAMIDACLERLHAARRLLSNQTHSSAVDELLRSTEVRIERTKKKARPKISIREKKGSGELTPSLFAEVTEIEAPTAAISIRLTDVQTAPIGKVAPTPSFVAGPRKRFLSRASAPPRKAAAPLSALVGHVPSGPVFIPAAQVPQERAKERVESAPARQPEAAPLTAELLAQRWIQSAGF